MTGSHESERAAKADLDETPEQPKGVRGRRFGESLARYSQMNEHRSKDPAHLQKMSHAGKSAGKSGVGSNHGDNSETIIFRNAGVIKIHHSMPL